MQLTLNQIRQPQPQMPPQQPAQVSVQAPVQASVPTPVPMQAPAPVQKIIPQQQVTVSLDTEGGFNLLQREAQMFAASNLVPQQFQNNVANCGIALNMAIRMQADPMSVLQNLYIVHGRPAWSSSFLIAMFNKSGRYGSIKYEMVGQAGTDSYGCRATCTELSTGETIVGPTVTMAMAKADGWYGKNGSKWKSLPELMLRYRAAAFLVRTTAPELTMGISTVEEMSDVYNDADVRVSPRYTEVITYPEPAPAQVQEACPPQEVVQEEPQEKPKRTRRSKKRTEENRVESVQEEVRLERTTQEHEVDVAGSEDVPFVDAAPGDEPPFVAEVPAEQPASPANLEFRWTDLLEDQDLHPANGRAVAQSYAEEHKCSYAEAQMYYLDHPQELMQRFNQLLAQRKG